MNQQTIERCHDALAKLMLSQKLSENILIPFKFQEFEHRLFLINGHACSRLYALKLLSTYCEIPYTPFSQQYFEIEEDKVVKFFHKLMEYDHRFKDMISSAYHPTKSMKEIIDTMILYQSITVDDYTSALMKLQETEGHEIDILRLFLDKNEKVI